jgi:DNA-binding NarL/FixJ family response regulator
VGHRVLIIDYIKERNNSPKLLETLSERGYSCHILHNSSSLRDSLFVNSFDLAIINLNKKELVNHLPSGKCKKIVLIGKGEKHLLPYVLNTQAIVQKESVNEILTAITVVNNGGFYISESLKNSLFPDMKPSTNQQQDHFVDLPSILTEMELRVAEELINDKTNQQIADTLYLSKRTVEYHIAASMQKLRVKSRVGLAVKITRANLLYAHSKKHLSSLTSIS